MSRLSHTLQHVPSSEYRSPSVLKLFVAGYQCGFRLTTFDGHPTLALERMAELMGAQLCQGKDFPEHEKKAFNLDDGTLISVFNDTWYLREITDRVRQAQMGTAMPVGREQWHFTFLPGLDGAYITYKEDGKRRKRQCWIASCPPYWEMTDDVYKGLWRWTRECLGPPDKFRGFGAVPWPDAYTLLREAAASGLAAGDGTVGGLSQGPCPPAQSGVPAAVVGVQHGAAEGVVAATAG